MANFDVTKEDLMTADSITPSAPKKKKKTNIPPTKKVPSQKQARLEAAKGRAREIFADGQETSKYIVVCVVHSAHV